MSQKTVVMVVLDEQDAGSLRMPPNSWHISVSTDDLGRVMDDFAEGFPIALERRKKAGQPL